MMLTHLSVVGTIDLEIPVKTQKFSDIKLLDGSDALVMETVLITIFYTAAPIERRYKRLPWLSKPKTATASGYAKVATLLSKPKNKLIKVRKVRQSFEIYRWYCIFVSAQSLSNHLQTISSTRYCSNRTDPLAGIHQCDLGPPTLREK